MPEDVVVAFIQRLLHNQCRYVGIYQPGEYQGDSYRVVLPEPRGLGRGPGRGYNGMYEAVLLETYVRADIDNLLRAIVSLEGTDGLRAVRHVNPGLPDEGLRLVWEGDAESAREIKAWGKRYQASEGKVDGGEKYETHEGMEGMEYNGQWEDAE